MDKKTSETRLTRRITQKATASGAVGQWFESTGARKEPTREARPEFDEERFRCR
jgi:hypothetical protein